MKKTLKYNVPVAITALVFVIILSMLIGTLRSVNSISKKVTAKYEVSHLKYGSPQTDTGKLVGYADQIIGIAGAAGVDCGALRSARDAFSGASATPFDLSQEYSVLRSEEAVVYGAASRCELSDSAEKSLVSYHTEFVSTCQRLAKNSYYNNQAKTYNSAIRSFPASLFFGDRKPAAVFE